MPPLRYHLKSRTATWLELFFDLIFVVVISKITHLLGHTHHGHLEEGLWLKFPLMLLPIWWLWMIHTYWSNLFDTDGKRHRLVTLLIMLQMIALSKSITTDWDSAYPIFIIFYLSIWTSFALLFITHRKHHEKHDRILFLRGVWILFCVAIAGSSVFFQPPVRYALFYTGLFLDILFPFIALRLLKGTPPPPVHTHHLIERMGLLIIILLGESVISLSAGITDVKWTLDSGLAAVSGAIMLGAAWWIYFDSYHHLADKQKHHSSIGLSLAYPHFLTCIGLSILANVIYHAIHTGLVRNEYQIMAAFGMFVFYVGKQIPYFSKFPIVRINIIVNSSITFLLCFISLFLPSNTWILFGLTLSLLAYVMLNSLTTLKKIKD